MKRWAGGQTGKAAPALAQHGGERTKAEEQGNDVTLVRGNAPAYLAARIKRDAPPLVCGPINPKGNGGNDSNAPTIKPYKTKNVFKLRARGALHALPALPHT